MPEPQITRYWRIRKHHPERFGQLCRILACGKLNSILVEFEDGYKMITIRYYVRKNDNKTNASS